MILKKIISAASKGNARAQRQLFDLTCDQLKSVALRYVADHSIAEDILQETYLRIFSNLPQFQYINDSATYGWLRQITATEAIRYIKKSKRWTASTALNAQDNTTFNHVFEDELYAILLTLPDQQRLVFNMHAIEGYTHREIAQKMDIAESSSRSLLTRARAQLKLQLTKIKSYEKAS